MKHDTILQGKPALYRAGYEAGYKRGYRAGYKTGYEAARSQKNRKRERSYGYQVELAYLGADAPPLVCLRRALEKGNE